MTVTKKKTGAISDVDRQYIIANKDKQTPDEIAKFIGKNIKVIEKEIKNYVSLPQADNDSARWHLKHTLEWKHLRLEFTPDELNLIEDKYVKYIEQMKEDITATEEAQLLNMIKIEVLMGRNLKARVKILDSVRVYEEAKEHILNVVDNNWQQLTAEDRDRVMEYQDKITAANNSENGRNDQYNQLQNQLNSLASKLKTSRDQRVDKILDPRFSFISYVKDLLNRDKQEKESRLLQLYGMSVDKEADRLTAPYQYADGQIDHPILSAEILDDLEQQDKEANEIANKEVLAS